MSDLRKQYEEEKGEVAIEYTKTKTLRYKEKFVDWALARCERLAQERDELRFVLERARNIIFAMNELDDWIGKRCGADKFLSGHPEQEGR